MKHGLWHLGLVFLALMGLAGRATGAEVYSPPDAAGFNLAQIDAVRTALTQHQVADAAKLVDALLAQHGEEIAQQNGATWQAVAVLIAQAVQTDQVAFTAEFTKQYDPAAHEALQAMKIARHDDPAALCALAARYPFTPTAGEALALAGQRSAEIGDLVAAQTLFAKSKLAGWTADAETQKLVDKIKLLCSGETVPPGEHLEATTYVGQLPFEARWYFTAGDAPAKPGNPKNPVIPVVMPEPHCFPLCGGSLIFLQTPKRLLAMKFNGGIAWSVAWPEDAAAKPTPAPEVKPGVKQPRPEQPSRPTLAGPAMLLPAVLVQDGVAQVVAAKIALPGQAVTMVRCFRAADGRELWNTSDQERLAELVFQGAPLICGRYVYLLAEQSAAAQIPLLLIALDTTTGRELWRTNVGSVLGPMANQWKPPAAADWRNLLVDTSSLAVADDLVIATPGVGCAIAVNRFTGKLRWLMKYGHMESLTARQNRYDNRAMLAGGVVAISPMDAPRVFGLDSDSGTVLWEGQAGEAVLCGGGDDSIVLATARGMMALDSRTGAKKWLIKPATGAITGPSIVVGKVALVPVSGQLSALSLVDGQVVLSPPRVPLLPALLAPEANRQMLQVDGVLANFGPPPLATAKPPK